jgi:hypothetical protein
MQRLERNPHHADNINLGKAWLYLSAVRGIEQLANELLILGIKANIDGEIKSYLAAAFFNNNVKVAKLLLNHGALIKEKRTYVGKATKESSEVNCIGITMVAQSLVGL